MATTAGVATVERIQVRFRLEFELSPPALHSVGDAMFQLTRAARAAWVLETLREEDMSDSAWEAELERALDEAGYQSADLRLQGIQLFSPLEVLTEIAPGVPIAIGFLWYFLALLERAAAVPMRITVNNERLRLEYDRIREEREMLEEGRVERAAQALAERAWEKDYSAEVDVLDPDSEG